MNRMPWKTLLGVTAAFTMMCADAQTPRKAPALPSIESFALHPSKDPDQLRTVTILQSGLNNSALNLSTAQKAEVDKIVDQFVKELLVLGETHPIEQGKRMSSAALERRQMAVGKLNASVNRIMNAEQRKTWENDKTARRSALESRLSKAAPVRSQ